MTLPGRRNSKAATCEDVDEDTQTIKPDTCTSANVSKKRSQSSGLNKTSSANQRSQNGSDSGYSSKTGTNESLASGHKKPSTPAVKTDMMERTPQPYARTSVRPTIKVDTARAAAPKKEEKFCHPRGICYTCDQVGYHCELSELPQSAAPPKSPKASKPAKAVVEKPKARRRSSNVPERPRSMYVLPTQQPVLIQHTPAASYFPQTPQTPSIYYAPTQYTYEVSTPVSAVSHDCPLCAEASHNHPIGPQFRELPAITFSPYQEQGHLHYHQHQTSHELQRTLPTSARARSDISRSSKTQIDRANMPPPPVPVTRRPPKDQSNSDTRRRTMYHDEGERANISSKRASKEYYDYGPPSAWKGSPEPAERPRNRKSVSYSDVSIDTSTPAHRGTLSRRSTEPLEERTVQAAEAYQASVSKNVAGLTAESLRTLEKPRHLASDAGTTRSRDSVRGKRASTVMSNSGQTSITIDGGIQVIIPPEAKDQDQDFNLQIGDFVISRNGDREAAQQKIKERKKLERAPSNASRDSRRVSSGANAADEPQISRQVSRKSGQSDQSDRPKVSPSSSKRSSRAPSVSRPEKERPKIRSHYDNPEDWYGA